MGSEYCENVTWNETIRVTDYCVCVFVNGVDDAETNALTFGLQVSFFFG